MKKTYFVFTVFVASKLNTATFFPLILRQRSIWNQSRLSDAFVGKGIMRMQKSRKKTKSQNFKIIKFVELQVSVRSA